MTHKHLQEEAIKAFQERTGDISTNTYAALLMFAEETLEERDREIVAQLENEPLISHEPESEVLRKHFINTERSRIRTYINNKEVRNP